jgi:uncharacterized protein YbaP (TraB family)
MLRRQVCLILGSLALDSMAHSSAGKGAGLNLQPAPPLWVIRRRGARVFLMGFGEAKDNSWFTPTVQRAFKQSSQLWLEVAPAPNPDNRDAAVKEAEAQQIKKLEHESGRTLFEALQPAVRSRLQPYLDKFGVQRESIETLRPWRAYYVITGAFWKQTKLDYEPVYVDEALRAQAIAQGKSIAYETPTPLDFAKFMASLSDAAQSEYIGWLIDYIDERRQGLQEDAFGWEAGNSAAAQRSLLRMRSKAPDLYQRMQIERNGWWAAKIDQLLSAGGTYFVGIGMLHVLGPDGIPNQLRRRGLVAPADLTENPTLEGVG